ncbi:MAG: hypothetical protein PHC51_09485 [bacterium]|nr:hypothetical protein [bacterium]
MTTISRTEAKHKSILPNGRSAKGFPDAKKWFAQITILDLLVSPAWRGLSKTATDMAIIIKAKHSKAAAFNNKINGKPVFSFTVSETVRVLGISRPTCTRALNELKGKGFIDVIDSSGILNGKGRPAIYTWSSSWRNWESPPQDNTNIIKARSMRK